MRVLVVTVGVVVVVLPGPASAQLAPRDQAQFEQRFTGCTLVSAAPDCNEGNGIDPIRFIGPGRFETGGLEGSYEYQGTSADTGTLTLTVDLLESPQMRVGRGGASSMPPQQRNSIEINAPGEWKP